MWRSSFVLVVALVLATNALIHSPPRIIKQPIAEEMLFQVASYGDTEKPFIIECEAEGEPAPKYRWIKNGKHFDFTAYDDRITQQPGRGTLTITKPRDEDLGQYQCFAENEHGIATSNSVFVRKSELNNFKDEEVHTETAQEGAPYKLQCQPPDGWPKPSVYWMLQSSLGGIKTINNSRMTLDPEGNLWFSNVTRFDAQEDAYYACAASSAFRNEYKLGNRVLLKVNPSSNAAQNRYAPTRQYISRRNEVALRGQKIEIFCIVGGTPLPQTVWNKDGRPIAWSDRVTQGNYGKSLVIKHASLDDRGSYTCDVSNGAGNPQSYTIILEIKAVPYFTVEPEIVNAAEEETVEFHCEAKGIPEPAIKWIHNGKPIEETTPSSRRIVQKNKIILQNIEKKDTGNYGCNATNALGYVYKDVYVNVLALPPEIEEAPGNQATVDEKDVTLKCKVFGAPKPKIKWIRNGQELTGGRYQKQESGDLIISKVQFGDAGDYTCHASNKLGVKEANGTLIVREHTRITEEPIDYEVVAGTLATFRCNAVSDPSLKLEIEWQWNGETIDFESQPRFTKSSDHSLTISNTIELDSGSYACVARTNLDEASYSATLTVQDVPNAPALSGIMCNAHDASISWEPKGDNRSPILYFIIQYNTSFTPDTWADAAKQVPSTDFSYTIPMSPWANYTYRVIAVNKVGHSSPSEHSESCTTQIDVPFKNPDNVEGKGTEPNNLVVSWTPMPEIDHNAPQFHYRVSWKRDVSGAEWSKQDIYDWQLGKFTVSDTPTFQRYKIRVQAVNEKGESNVAVKEVEGYSGEDKPMEAPQNFSMLQVVSGNAAMVSWIEVAPESVRGHFRGYKIQTWVEGDEENVKEILMKSNTSKALVDKFTPDAVNVARILAFNDRFNGPNSNTITFETPEGLPSTVQSLQAFPLGSSAFWLQWKRPLLTNGKLQGYRIYYEVVKGTELGPRQEREPRIQDPDKKNAKLAGLEANTKYRIHIVGYTKVGEGEDYYIEATTNPVGGGLGAPDKPNFSYEIIPSDNGNAKAKIEWKPYVTGGNPGSHFYVQYREKGQPSFLNTEPTINEEHFEVGGLHPESDYEFRVVSVDGVYETPSETQRIRTSDSNGVTIQHPEDNSIATAGWFIGMILALAFLILLLVIICIIKRNRGGKYDVHDRELANGRQDYPDEGGFHEYSQPLDNKSQGRQSLSSKHGPESDTDSMAEYGDGDTGLQFTEDGSFIGQYVPGKLNPPVSPHSIQQPGTSGAATSRRQKEEPGNDGLKKVLQFTTKKRVNSRKKPSKNASPTKNSLRSNIKIVIDESNDIIYNDCKEKLKLKKKKKDSKTRLQAVKIVKSSTPTLDRVKKKKTNSIKNDLFHEISPIRRSVSCAKVTHDEAEQKSKNYLQLELNDVIAGLKLKRELSALNIREAQPRNQDVDAVLQQIENLQSKQEIVIPNRSISPVKPINNKKSVYFKPEQNRSENEDDGLKFKPGKWRKSLAAWRKSHNQVLNKRKSARKFVALFPIKTDPNVIKRFTQKLEVSLADCSLLLEKSDEGQLQSALSILDSTVECATIHEPTTFVQHPQRKRETSVFKRTSIFYGLQSPLIHEIDVVTNLSARQILLRRCGQQEPLLFDDIYAQSQLPNCKKIGEGVYGEVFSYRANDVTIVLKIIPIEGDLIVNGEQQKRFDEILSEVVISMELSGLRNGKENVTDGFVNVKRVTCVKGSYPQHLIDEWENYNDSHFSGSENDHPEIFSEEQHYIVFELCDAGIDLEAFQFKQAEEAFSVFLQVALTLAVAEIKFEFEHRDLHWGNILVSRTTTKSVEYRFDGKVIQIPTHGVKATIIDYTLSRMVYDDAVLYNNLADDEELFNADGDYQFDIYRFMRDRLENDFKRFEPFTNLYWLHYLIDKLIDGARYKNSKNDKHKSAVNKMMKLRDELLIDFRSASDYVVSLQN